MRRADTTIVDCDDAEKLALEAIVKLHDSLVVQSTGQATPESVPQF